MSKIAATETESIDGPQIVDVWSRTSRRYRRRSVFMLVLLALLFAGLCCFTFWLRTGVFWPWTCDTYADLLTQSFRPTGSEQITLSDFLTSPISVKDVWIHGIIMGLLFASLSSIPLLVAILYRFPFSIIFPVMVVFLAAMPWLGITVLIGCGLTALRPFRFSFRYASALMGLIPIAVYFVSASLEPADTQPKLIQHQALLYAPWVLAVLGSCIICAIALAIARLINYRPGGIPLVLALFFAIPVILFYARVGRDELEYRLLEQEIGPGSHRMFTTVDIGAKADRAATRHWSRSRNTSYDEIQKRMLEKAKSSVLLRTESDRELAVAHCDAFISQFPKSRYVPNVLFMKGRVQDQRIQRTRLEQDHRAEFRYDVPNRASRRTWETLVERFPESPLCAMALYKLAILNARDGGDGIDAAIDALETLSRRFDIDRPTPELLASSDKRNAHPAIGLGMDQAALVQRSRRVREMLVACREDQPKPYRDLFGCPTGGPDVVIHPIQSLLWLDETDPHYKANLEEIARHFEESHTSGYIEIRLSLLERAVSRRIQRFRNAARSLAGQPAGAEALFYLGDALQDDSILDEAKLAYGELTQKYPESCWAREAKERLSSLSMLEATTR